LRNILYLVHRLPYPPNKGDKVRSFHLLKHLSIDNNVFLGTFIDDPEDEVFVPNVQFLCKSLYFERINKNFSKIRSLLGLLYGDPLTVRYYNSSSFRAWVNNTIKINKIDSIVIFSSAMVQFIDADLYSKTLVDFVDVDSKKWSEFAEKTSFPLSLIYRREGRYLLNYERSLASKVKHSFFVTEKERDVFTTQAPESSLKTSALNNGVDSDYFSSDNNFISPFDNNTSEFKIVFTGAMDYWPNIDSVIWFANEILPALLKINSNFCFYIVGRNPSQAVLNLRSKNIFITGTVDDVRPYLQYASVVVAPLRIARGIQNKILEAMSMSKVVVASTECVKAIDLINGNEILSADSAEDFVRNIQFVIENEDFSDFTGKSARLNILKKYSWSFHLKKIDFHLDSIKCNNI
jgi:sugar transferase (PEP-CTERM/EpsH1 system associated)